MVLFIFKVPKILIDVSSPDCSQLLSLQGQIPPIYGWTGLRIFTQLDTVRPIHLLELWYLALPLEAAG